MLLMRGTPGTEVTLDVETPQGTRRTLALVREELKQP
jgi:C-terminal processing protease CtpA/Prc